MTTINDLNTTATLVDDDKLLVWKAQPGASRAITAEDAAAYFQAEISGTFQPLSTFLTNIAALGPLTEPNRYIVVTGVDTVDLVTGANLLSNIGGQPIDATLTALAALGLENRKLIRGTGVDTAENVFGGDLFGIVDVKDYGAVCDGVTNDTAAVALARAEAEATGKVLVFPNGTCLTDPIVASGPLKVYVARSAVVKLRNSATKATVNGIPTWALFVMNHDDSSLIVDGWLDGNRDNQDKAGFAAAGAYAWRFYGVISEGLQGARLSGGCFRLRVRNVAAFALRLAYHDDSTVESVFANECGGIAEYHYNIKCTTGPNEAGTIDHDEWYVIQHTLDLFGNEDCMFGRYSVRDHAGYGVPASLTGISAWISGMTALFNENCIIEIGNLTCRDDPACQKSLAMSLLGNKKCNFSGPGVVYGYTDNALEFGGNETTVVADLLLDGAYRISTLSSDEQNVGVQIAQTNFAREDNDILLARGLRTTTDCQFVRVRARRWLSYGWVISGVRGVKLTDCEGVASYGGLFMQASASVADSFPNGIAQGIDGVLVDGGAFEFNETHGFWALNGTNVKVTGRTRMRNNGQAVSYPGGRRKDGTAITAGDGVHTQTGTSKTGWRLEEAEAYDDQTTTGSKVSADPSNPSVLWAADPKLWAPGQLIKLYGAGVAGADLTTMINEIEQDALYLRDPVVTFPLVSGTGTISTSGRTVTGSGTDLDDEVNWRAWIKVGSDYRQIIRATTNTAGVIANAFPSDLSGASFEIVEIDADQVRSQRYGVTLSADTASPVVKGMDYRNGNVTGNMNDATVSGSVASIRPDTTPIIIPAVSLFPAGASPTVGTVGGGRAAAYLLSDAASDTLATTIFIPANWSRLLRVRLQYVNAGAGSGAVVWNVSSRSTADSVTVNTAFAGPGDVADTALAQDVMRDFAYGVLTVTPGTPTHFRLFRNGSAGGDTLTNDVGLMSVILEDAG